jgi:FAD:protein FMN transferase
MPLDERLQLTEATRQWPVWGTTARIVVTDATRADAAESLVRDWLGQVGAACSRFEPSELDAVQAAMTARQQGGMAAQPGGVPVSALLAELVAAGLDAAARTGGDVDPTLAQDLCALGYDRDFAEVGRGSAGAIPVSVVRRVRHDWREVRLTGVGSGQPRLRFPAGLRLDLGASAKAFAADRAAQQVAAHLDCGVLVALGGDIAVAGPAPADGWQVLVQDGAGQPASRVSLHSGGMATSSTMSRAWRHGTRAVHHVLDPATGQPADPVWRTATVVAGSCAEANMLSTASIVRGWTAMAALRETGLPARLVHQAGDVHPLNGWPDR